METDRRVCVLWLQWETPEEKAERWLEMLWGAEPASLQYMTAKICCILLITRIWTCQGLSHNDKDQTFKMDEVWTHLDKDLKLVFIESLNTETRMNITGLARLSWKLPIRISVPAPALNSRPALKSLEFQKTEKVLELFWKKSGRPWKVWNLSVVKLASDRCVWKSWRQSVRTLCHSCYKAGRRTA